MFAFKVRKWFGKTFGPWVTAAPPRPKPQPTFRPRLEQLEDRLALAGVNLYWDPTSGANASTTANWDLNSLRDRHHPPGQCDEGAQMAGALLQQRQQHQKRDGAERLHAELEPH